jgi:hypothetical protein
VSCVARELRADLVAAPRAEGSRPAGRGRPPAPRSARCPPELLALFPRQLARSLDARVPLRVRTPSRSVLTEGRVLVDFDLAIKQCGHVCLPRSLYSVRMTLGDPLPRGTHEIDDEIARIRRALRDINRRRRITFLTCAVFALMESAFIVLAFRSHNANSAWAGAATLVGFFVGIPLFSIVGVGIFAQADSGDERFDISGATVVKRRMELRQLAIERREQLVGNLSGQALIFSRYREAMPELVARYRNQANHYRASNNILQAFVIVASLATSAVTGLLGASAGVRAGIVGLTLAIAIASSMGSFFRLRERGAQLQKTADLIEIEFRAVELGIKDYKDLKRQEALRLFVQKVEDIRSEHMTRQRQLDQPPDLRYIDPSSISIDRRTPVER